MSYFIMNCLFLFIACGFREASLRDWNADTGAQSIMHVLHLHWCEVEMWGCDKLEQNIYVVSKSQCLKKCISHKHKKPRTLTWYKMLT